MIYCSVFYQQHYCYWIRFFHLYYFYFVKNNVSVFQSPLKIVLAAD